MIWSISAYQAVNTQNTNQSAAHEYQNTATRVDQSCVGIERAALIKCIQEQVEASKEAERAEYDLNAQSQMAFWANLMFWATAFTALVTGVGVWFVKRTLEATLEAVEDTSEATEAMRDANEIARDSMQRQLRAYLQIKVDEVPPRAIVCTADGEQISFEMINRGQTPAKILKISSVAIVAPYPLPEEFEVADLWQVTNSGGILHSGIKFDFRTNVPIISAEHRQHIVSANAEQARLYAFASVEYRDIFENLHVEDFCSTILFDDTGSNTKLYEKHNHST